MKDFFKNVGALLATVIILAGLMMAAAIGSWTWRYFTAETRGVVDAEEQIESAASRITNYEHFYDLCGLVQSREDALHAQRAQLAETNDPDEQARIRTNIAGLEAQRSRAIRRYNADADKAYTRARFLGDDLPRELNINRETTQCAP